MATNMVPPGVCFCVVVVRPDTGEGFLNSSHFVAVKGWNVKDKSSGFFLNKTFYVLDKKSNLCEAETASPRLPLNSTRVGDQGSVFSLTYLHSKQHLTPGGTD